MSWEVFYTTVTNSSSKMTLDDGIGKILLGELHRESMGLSINDMTEALYSKESAFIESRLVQNIGGKQPNMAEVDMKKFERFLHILQESWLTRFGSLHASKEE